MDAVVEMLLLRSRIDEANGLETGGFASGYPGSPVGGLQDALGRRERELNARRIYQVPGLNEETAATSVWGAQAAPTMPGAMVDGVFGLWYGKAPGVDRAGDALRHANMRGSHRHGGALVLAGDDPNASATVFPTDSLAAFVAWGMPVLYPGSVQEIVDLGIHGYELSRCSGLWVGFKLVTTVADGSGTVVIDPDRYTFVHPGVEVAGSPFAASLRVNEPGPPMREAEADLYAGRLMLAERYVAENHLNPVVVDPPEATIGIVAPGKSYYDVRRALGDLGLDERDLHRNGIRLKKVSAVHPIGRDEWARFSEGLAEVIVVEEKRPHLEDALKLALYGERDQPAVSGKRDPDGAELFPPHGELSPHLVADRMARRLVARGVLAGAEVPRLGRRVSLPVVANTARTGFFCSGCPHNRSLHAPEGAVVAAGIGCHLLNLIVEREEYGDLAGFTQMGGEGAQWVGQAPFTEVDHIFQNVGDGTFHHSASLALRLAVASGVNITYKLLYNSAVGMTGGQAVMGTMAVPALTRSLEAEGVKKIIVTTDDVRRHPRRSLSKIATVWPRDRLIEAQEDLAAIPGVTVLIHDQVCAAERRRRIGRGTEPRPTKKIFINERVCEGCGDCNAKSQCLSVEPVQTVFGRKTRINQSSCNFDYSCLDGDCPSFLTVDTSKATRVAGQFRSPPTVPDPEINVDQRKFAAHLVGIGGTGVVSAARILGNAAASEGLRVRELDLPGSTIKAGPVVSQVQVYQAGDTEPAATIGDGRATLFLAFDLLGSTTEANIAPASDPTTVVVGSTSLEPTGAMAVESSIELPSVDALVAELDHRSRSSANVYFEAADLAEAILGDRMFANTLLIGAAYQAGEIPFSLESMREAIRTAGIAVEKNLAAFEWGRALVADPSLVPALGLGRRPTGGGVAGSWAELAAPFLELGAVYGEVVERAHDLEGYQGQRYAERYLKACAEVLRADQEALGVGDRLVTADFVRGLHKLMAYKDEYEVARLLLMDAARQEITREFGHGARVSWNLHPPVLKAMGLNRKIELGPWFKPVLVGLRGMRRLRGLAIDPFGRTRMRRLERRLIEEYTAAVDAALEVLDATTVAAVRQITTSPETIRGYESVKLTTVGTWCDQVDEAAAQLGIAYRVPHDVRTAAVAHRS